jgi:hypothetical protein
MHIKSLSIHTILPFALAVALVAGPLIANTPAAQAYTIESDKPIKVKWGSGNVVASSCRGTGSKTNWGNSGNLYDTFNYAANTFSVGNYTFTYSCTGASGTDYAGIKLTKTVTLNVIPGAEVALQLTESQTSPFSFKPSLNLNTTDRDISLRETFDLSWNYSDRFGTCKANWGASGAVLPPQGSVTLSNNNESFNPVVKRYTITCSSTGIADSSTYQDISFAAQTKVCGIDIVCDGKSLY